jgi:hypothetical protein
MLSNKNIPEIVSFTSDRWNIIPKTGATMAYFKGKECILLDRATATYLEGVDLKDGMIEFDVAFPNEKGYMGMMFHLKDINNYEQFYLRTENSGTPYSSQYTPLINGLSASRLCYGEGYNANINFEFDEWIHIRLVISGREAEIYIQDMDTPVQYIPELKGPTQSGTIGVQVLGLPEFYAAPGYFTNFSYNYMDNPPLKRKPATPREVPIGTVKSWWVSDVFNEELLEDKIQITKEEKEKGPWKEWTEFNTDSAGIANLDWLNPVKEDANCVFAAITIKSAKEQVKKIKFGFADRVYVYFNGKKIFFGDNTEFSRDYRFLGIMGYFEKPANSEKALYKYYYELYLPLEKGENELWLGIAGSISGWGVIACFEDMEGITILQEKP